MVWFCCSIMYFYIFNKYFNKHKKLGSILYFCLLFISIIFEDSFRNLECIIVDNIVFLLNFELFYIIKLKFIFIFTIIIIIIKNSKVLLAKFANGYFKLVFYALENTSPPLYFNVVTIFLGNYCGRYLFTLYGFENFIMLLLFLFISIALVYFTIYMSLVIIFLVTLQSKQVYIAKSFHYLFKISEKSIQRKIVKFVRKNFSNQKKNICCFYHH